MDSETWAILWHENLKDVRDWNLKFMQTFYEHPDAILDRLDDEEMARKNKYIKAWEDKHGSTQ